MDSSLHHVLIDCMLNNAEAKNLPLRGSPCRIHYTRNRSGLILVVAPSTATIVDFRAGGRSAAPSSDYLYSHWGVSKLGFCAVYFGNKHCSFENTHVYLEKNTTPSGLGYFPSV